MATAIAPLPSVSADAQTDSRRRIPVDNVVPAYPVPYVVPRPEDGKAVLDRMKGFTVDTTKLPMFDHFEAERILE